ncbi:unnamed protein product [Symbiodinium natans]|uniref:Uncharacterized protein n=1 Tax=Symbiodinium natans TaxID=878477 RepID=A0A812PZT8_9DINO|nr:unnamed protein product [Symbiodinium natans]
MLIEKIAAAADQARTEAASALERHVERAKVAATGVVEQARGSIALSTAPVPCSVCGRSTRGGDGGACGDVGEMSSKVEAADAAPRCYSCLTAEERDKVVVTVKQQHLTLDSFFAGEPPPVHEDPPESVLEKAHRLGSLALGGAVEMIGWIPGLGATTKGAVKVLHKVVKFGPLAMYSSELVETLQLLVVMANRSGVARGGSTNGVGLETRAMPASVSSSQTPLRIPSGVLRAFRARQLGSVNPYCRDGKRSSSQKLPKSLSQGRGRAPPAPVEVDAYKTVTVELKGREGYNSSAVNGLWHYWRVKGGRLAFQREINLAEGKEEEEEATGFFCGLVAYESC